jgi:hypothetical protein
MKISLDDQIAEIDRELKLRETVYANHVMRKKMSQEKADLHMARMVAVLQTLIWLKTHREKIVDLIAP